MTRLHRHENPANNGTQPEVAWCTGQWRARGFRPVAAFALAPWCTENEERRRVLCTTSRSPAHRL